MMLGAPGGDKRYFPGRYRVIVCRAVRNSIDSGRFLSAVLYMMRRAVNSVNALMLGSSWIPQLSIVSSRKLVRDCVEIGSSVVPTIFVFGHYKVVPRGLCVDFENKGFNLICFDFDDGLVELDPVVEALTPQAHFFPLPWFVAYFQLCLLLCCDISVFPTEVALLTQRKVGNRGKFITDFTEALLFLSIVVQIANIILPPRKNGGVVLCCALCCGPYPMPHRWLAGLGFHENTLFCNRRFSVERERRNAALECNGTLGPV